MRLDVAKVPAFVRSSVRPYLLSYVRRVVHPFFFLPRRGTQWGEIRKKRKNDFKGLKYTLDPCDHCRVEIFEIRSSQGGENPI